MKIGITGYGNLGRSLAEGLIKSGVSSPSDVLICDNSPDACKSALSAFGITSAPDFNSLVQNSDVVFLTVKSYVFEKLTDTLNKPLLVGKTIVSFMAGVGIEHLRTRLPGAVVIRAMPSLAIAACDGVIGYTAAPPEIEAVFHKLGYAFETPPEDIEKVMAFSSCGLGFAAYLIDAFSSAGAAMGFSNKTCAEIAARTFKNAIERGSFGDTVKAVATPGGATEQGVLHMDENKVFEIVAAAVQKAYDKMA